MTARRPQLRPLPVGDAKSQAGRRVVGLPGELVELLRQPQVHAGRGTGRGRQFWTEGGWMFANATGRPLSLNLDYREWKALGGR